jgi:hypothetical protein
MDKKLFCGGGITYVTQQFQKIRICLKVGYEVLRRVIW